MWEAPDMLELQVNYSCTQLAEASLRLALVILCYLFSRNKAQDEQNHCELSKNTCDKIIRV